ncbi:response regulator [Spirochaetia bacterium 38H-sp]|uniref:Response regulator n=1 Tax=Rarispira pelagica TaxID=3141764 RepID=A0ABU9UA63_9SPIR
MSVSRKLLLVEDEDSIRLSLRDFLVDKGYDVMVASDGLGAIRQLTDYDFDLIISDYRMDNLGGSYWVRFLSKFCSSVPVLIISGFLPGDTELPFPVVYKPFDYDDILIKIEEVMGG